MWISTLVRHPRAGRPLKASLPSSIVIASLEESLLSMPTPWAIAVAIISCPASLVLISKVKRPYLLDENHDDPSRPPSSIAVGPCRASAMRPAAPSPECPRWPSGTLATTSYQTRLTGPHGCEEKILVRRMPSCMPLLRSARDVVHPCCTQRRLSASPASFSVASRPRSRPSALGIRAARWSAAHVGAPIEGDFFPARVGPSSH